MLPSFPNPATGQVANTQVKNGEAKQINMEVSDREPNGEEGLKHSVRVQDSCLAPRCFPRASQMLSRFVWYALTVPRTY